MTRITAVWTLSLLVLSGVALADPQPWMVKENPDELGVLAISESGCPDFDIEALVHGILIRSRIRPTTISASRDLNLEVGVSCLEIETSPGFYSYHTNVRFGVAPQRGVYMVYTPGYTHLGHGERPDIVASVRGAVEEAITDYLQANFDL